MAFLDFIKTFDTDYLFLPAGAADTAKEVATQQEKLVQAQYEKGLVGYPEFQSRMQEISGASTFDALFQDPANSPTKTFFDEVGAGIGKIPDNIRSVLGGTIGGILRSIPLNLWILLFLALTVWIVWNLNLLGRLRYKG